MKERRNVKINVNMFEDTKLKIIDTKPERDLIHYIWFRMVTLAGKVNRDGELYLSENIPYTPEILAIEFNRGTYQINLALDILIELEMIEIIKDNVYKVKNFTKHQNVAKKGQSRVKAKEEKSDEKNNKHMDLEGEKNTESAADTSSSDNENINNKDKKSSKGKNREILNKTCIPISKDINKVENNVGKDSDTCFDIGSGIVKNQCINKKHTKKRRGKAIKIKDKDIKEVHGDEEFVTLYDGEVKIKDGVLINSWNFDNTK